MFFWREASSMMLQLALPDGAVSVALAAMDKQERGILERAYIHRQTAGMTQLASELGVELSEVYRLRDSALRHFATAMCEAARELQPAEV